MEVQLSEMKRILDLQNEHQCSINATFADACGSFKPWLRKK